ncbi:MAG: hypothetical protein KGI89_02225 [Euryarchaeota archaeon]|nr:hypothetical protein [Euryarchaeota archaeon]
MNREHVRAFARMLSRNGVRFVVVGGAAVLTVYPSESRDVDVLMVARDYDRAVEALDHDPSIESMTRESGEMAGGHFVVGPTLVRFDLLNPSAFSGTLTGDEFFDHVVRYGSKEAPEGRMATVPVVWYMRLSIEGEAWLVQVQKVLRDLRAGAPWGLMTKVKRLASRFGVGPRVAERIERVREEAERAGLLRPEEKGTDARTKPAGALREVDRSTSTAAPGALQPKSRTTNRQSGVVGRNGPKRGRPLERLASGEKGGCVPPALRRYFPSYSK